MASPGALKQVKLVASELRASPPKNEASGFARGSEASEASSFGALCFAPLKMKQVASPGALKQVKLVASELRASPPKNEAGGFARGSEASELVASELRASTPKNEANGFARSSETSEASSFGASRFAP